MAIACFAVFSAFVFHLSLASFPIPYITPESCNSGEYFDPFCLTCRRCGAEKQAALQQATPDGLGCTCKPQYFLKEKNGPTNIICSSCPKNKIPSLSGLDCVSCNEDNPFNSTIGFCEPCSNGILVEDGEKLSCVSCLSKSIPEKHFLGCKKCPQGHVLSDGKCTCYANLTLSGGHCLPLVRNKASLFTVTFENGATVRSSFFVEHFNAAYHNSKEHHNATALNVLANMCVMLLYKLDSRLIASDSICTEFFSLVKEQTADCQIPGHSYGFSLLYGLSDANTEIYQHNVPNVFSSNPNLDSSKLQFVVKKFNACGQYLGMVNIKSHELQLCHPSSSNNDYAFIFGTDVHQMCEIPLQEIWDESTTIFYELYLLNDIKNNRTTIYPVPVLIKDLRVNGDLVNKEKDMSKWQLVKRFFVTDGIAGIEAGTTNTAKRNQPSSKVFRYAASVSLVITLKSSYSPGEIYPPLLTISYDEVTQDDYFRNKKVPIQFSVSYEMDQSTAINGISIAAGVLGIFSIAYSIVQTWSWFRHAGKHAIDILTLGKFCLFAFSNLATVFFVVVFCTSLHWLFVFKMQDVAHLLLPTHSQEKVLRTYLAVAFVMKALQVIHLLATQCNVDIFFLDWERPRYRSSTVGSQIPSSVSKNIAESSAGASSAKPILGKVTQDKLSSELAGISIWRTYFVANEWAEIQCMRKVNLSFQLFGTLLFLKAIGLESLTFSAPLFSSNDANLNVPYNSACRFALGAAVYLLLALVQVAFRKGVYERFVEDKLQQYIDLCSVSNVSVFVLMTKRFGYYIHGRSAHGKADVNMKEMHELLRREEEDLCGHRGLLPNTEQQTFLMSLPSGVYDQFKRLLGPLTTYSQAADRMQGVGGRLSKVDIDKVVNTYHMLNKFLTGFIEHAFKDLDYVVKDKVMVEHLLDVELYEVADRGYFYNDSGHSFDQVLLFGNESVLLMFDVLLFCIVDIASSDYVLSAVITYLVGKVIQAFRQSAGRRNLVRKALVDERFLT